MIKQSKLKALLVTAVMVVPSASIAQHGSDDNPQAPAAATVHFGILPTGALGPPPCFQVLPLPAIAPGGPGDPCAYKIHVLTPEETSIQQGGEVTFQIHGGGHAMAIYRVDKDTTRDEVGQYLCPGNDPADFHGPLDLHPCATVGAANAAAAHEIKDGDGDVVIVAAANPTPVGVVAVHPNNRVWYTPGRRMSAGGVQFLNGGALPTGATGTGAQGGQLHSYQFLKTGRYLVICMNRGHFLNDWMFGFVNVIGDDD